MKIVSSRYLGPDQVYDLSVDHPDHSFIHESGVIAHNCAYVIANRPIHEFIPLTTVSGVRVTSYTAPSVEAVGGLKMDFLVINSLNDIGNCIKMVQARAGLPEGTFAQTFLHGRRVPSHRLVPVMDAGGCCPRLADIWDLPEDQDVFADIATGRTETVFQFNTPGAVQWLAHFGYRKPNGNYAIDSIEAMAAFTALDRPGPLNINVPNPDDKDSEHNMLVEYARRARGANPSPGVLPVFDQFIPETYGINCYQEQLQRMYQQLTGCSGPEAEEFRSNVAKKKKAKIEKAYAPFIRDAGAKIGKETAEAAWKFFITWAEYGFNKSHAVCYAVIGYACAYLKHYYPLEWWTSVLRNAAKNEVSDKFWRYCGDRIDLPDCKLSGQKFEIQNERIRAPLSLLKGVGENAHKQLTAGAPYTDIADFCMKIEQHRIQTGEFVEKEVKFKDKTDKVHNEKGRFVGKEKVQVERTLKKGRSSLNRKIIQTLIVSGAMDSLFPPDLHLGEQMQAYEHAMAAAETATNLRYHPENSRKKPKIVKAKRIEEKEWDVGELKRYQMRKATLPIYGLNLLPPVLRADITDALVQEGDYTFVLWTPPKLGHPIQLRVVGAQELEDYEIRGLPEGQAVQVGVVAYIEDQEIKLYGEGRREMCKLRFDVEGQRFEYVRWGGKAKFLPDIFKTKLKGAIVVMVLNKYKDDRPFVVEDLFVAEPPLDLEDDPEPEKPEEEKLETENETNE